MVIRAPRTGADIAATRVAASVPIVGMFLLAVGLIIWRRPDAITYPQFWAEDGAVWFADAYNHGIAAVLYSYQGYLQTLPRLVALPASRLSLQHAALLFNLIGISIQAAPAAVFVSSRFARLAPSLRVRSLLALAYVLIPSFELNATLTNAQWHLAILAVLVLIAEPSKSRPWRVVEFTAVMLSGLTGPFAALLLPVSVTRCWLAPVARRWYGTLSVGLGACLLAQGWAVLHGHRGHIVPLGPTIHNVTDIITNRVVLAGSLGKEGSVHVFSDGSWSFLPSFLIAALAIILVITVLFRSSSGVRLFLLYCFGITAVAMLSPLGIAGTSALTTLAQSSSDERYFLTAELAWIVCVTWAVIRVRNVPLRLATSSLLGLAFLSGLLSSWTYPAYVDHQPARYTQVLRNAPVGTTIVVPLNPDWTMTLIRH